ncbi:flagellar assembly protein FliW [Peribacillus asahii]|uniref:flagellar assembly protein FliW n=1 Tax=Peribacillus asahii TaxID=228899 RepID=UPI0037F9E9A3
MNIQTKFHSEIEINKADVYTFKHGIPGFLEEKQFVLLTLDETPFFVLQSVVTPEIAFILINPFDVFKDYEIDLSEDVLVDLGIESEADVRVLAILTVRDPFEQTTANLQAPVILNGHNKLGKQFIMKTDMYITRHAIFQPSVTQYEEVK